MKRRLLWIVVGGLVFWLPVIAVGALLREKTTLLPLNAAPLIALVIARFVVRIQGGKAQWGWILAGIYILGPTAMLAPSWFTHHAPSIPGDTLFSIAFCLFPPMTLWMAVLNGTIFSVLLATVALPLLVAAQNKSATDSSFSRVR